MIRQLLRSLFQKRSPSNLITEGPVRVENGVEFTRKVKVGAYSFIGKNCILGPNLESIGKFCSIASGVILGPNSHPLNKLSTSAVFYSKTWGIVQVDKKKEYNNRPVVVENDVWIGHNAVIIGAARIGNGSVVAAGSVVTKDVPDYAIVGGVPARILRYRFDEETIKELLDKAWWNEPIAHILQEYEEYSRKWTSN